MNTWMIFKNLMTQISISGSKTGFRNGEDQTQVSLILHNYIFCFYFYTLNKFVINKIDLFTRCMQLVLFCPRFSIELYNVKIQVIFISYTFACTWLGKIMTFVKNMIFSLEKVD